MNIANEVPYRWRNLLSGVLVVYTMITNDSAHDSDNNQLDRPSK